MIKKRVILWWLMITGIICHMFLMTNIHVAVISMVKSKDYQAIADDKIQADKFDWDDQQKSIIFGAFYWFAWASELCGGILAHKYGSKITFGLTNFVGCLLCSTIPTASYISWKLVVVIRVLQGTIASIGLPAGIVTIIGQWSPPDERGKFISVLLGTPLGISIGYSLFGFIADKLGWPYVFHITMALGTVWYLMWCYFVYDTPDKHPRISEKEKLYIKKSLENNAIKENLPIPWKEICTSRAVLINVICTFGQTWAFFGTSMYLPMYLSNIHNTNSTMIGLVTGISFATKAVLQITAGVVTDSMIKCGISKTKVRNIAVLLGVVIAGVLLSCVIFVEHDAFWSLTLIVGYFLISSFSSVGTAAAVIDMSPNFCGIIQGMVCTLIALSGFFCSAYFNLLSFICQDKSQVWGYYFLSSGLVGVIPGILFILFSNSELQPWNNPKESGGEVLQNLNNRNDASL